MHLACLAEHLHVPRWDARDLEAVFSGGKNEQGARSRQPQLANPGVLVRGREMRDDDIETLSKSGNANATLSNKR
jgi:hypothetical protein